MHLDLRLLKDMHPLLPATCVAGLVHSAGLALELNGHRPVSPLSLTLNGDTSHVGAIDWETVDQSEATHLDAIRTTEVGAEAVSLALVSVAEGWVERRRLQRGEFADWLLVDRDGHAVALEVSGIASQFDPQRLRTKVQQASKAPDAVVRAACVVAFEPPLASLARAEEWTS